MQRYMQILTDKAVTQMASFQWNVDFKLSNICHIASFETVGLLPLPQDKDGAVDHLTRGARHRVLQKRTFLCSYIAGLSV